MLGLVVEGGANRTYFSIGAMDVLMENKIYFDYIVGTSAGISNAMNYASGQIGRGLEIGLNYISNKQYYGFRHILNKKNRSLFNIDYVFKKIPNEIVPYDYNAFKNFKGEAEAAVTNLETGLPEYLKVSPEDNNWSVLVASCSLPLMFPIASLNGNKYMDGGITDSIPYMHAFEKGCNKLIVILTREPSYFKKPSFETNFSSLFFKKYPKFKYALQNRYAMYNEQKKNLSRLEKQGKVLVLQPKNTALWRRTETNPKIIKNMYDEGYELTKKQIDKIIEFIGCDNND